VLLPFGSSPLYTRVEFQGARTLASPPLRVSVMRFCTTIFTEFWKTNLSNLILPKSFLWLQYQNGDRIARTKSLCCESAGPGLHIKGLEKVKKNVKYAHIYVNKQRRQSRWETLSRKVQYSIAKQFNLNRIADALGKVLKAVMKQGTHPPQDIREDLDSDVEPQPKVKCLKHEHSHHDWKICWGEAPVNYWYIGTGENHDK